MRVKFLEPGQARNDVYAEARKMVAEGAAGCANDLDRIQLAFKGLRRLGYLTRANTLCCSSCLVAQVTVDVEKRMAVDDVDKLPAEKKAWVGWNRQSNDALEDRNLVSHLFMTWGAPDGVEIAGMMAYAGLRVDWDGSEAKCIVLVPRPDVPHRFSNPGFYSLPNQNCAICSRLEDDHLAWERSLSWNRRRVA